MLPIGCQLLSESLRRRASSSVVLTINIDIRLVFSANVEKNDVALVPYWRSATACIFACRRRRTQEENQREREKTFEACWARGKENEDEEGEEKKKDFNWITGWIVTHYTALPHLSRVCQPIHVHCALFVARQRLVRRWQISRDQRGNPADRLCAFLSGRNFDAYTCLSCKGNAVSAVLEPKRNWFRYFHRIKFSAFFRRNGYNEQVSESRRVRHFSVVLQRRRFLFSFASHVEWLANVKLRSLLADTVQRVVSTNVSNKEWKKNWFGVLLQFKIPPHRISLFISQHERWPR